MVKLLFNSVKMLYFAAILMLIYVHYVVIVMLNTLGPLPWPSAPMPAGVLLGYQRRLFVMPPPLFSSSSPHAEHSGSLRNFITHRCLLSVVWPVSNPTRTLSSRRLSPRADRVSCLSGPWISDLACLHTGAAFHFLGRCSARMQHRYPFLDHIYSNLTS